MQQQPGSGNITCPNCQTVIAASSRFCPACGDEQESQRNDSPTQQIPTVQPQTPDEWTANRQSWDTAREQAPRSSQQDWTASPAQWPTPAQQQQYGGPPHLPRSRGRTWWIIAAILGFLIFCCCGAFFVMALVSARDAALHDQLTMAIGLYFT